MTEAIGNATFEPNQPRVVFEESDSVVLIVDLHSGAYFALDQDASRVWQALIGGSTADQAALATNLEVTDVQRLSADLLGVGLLRQTDGEPVSPTDGSHSEAAESVGFERYVDLQDLMTLDPIHDVDPAAGWPNR